MDKMGHTYIIKHQRLCYMAFPPDAQCLMDIKLYNHKSIEKWEAGDGLSIFLWLDNWHSLGPLFQKLGSIVVLNSGGSLSAKVASIIHSRGYLEMTKT